MHIATLHVVSSGSDVNASAADNDVEKGNERVNGSLIGSLKSLIPSSYSNNRCVSQLTALVVVEDDDAALLAHSIDSEVDVEGSVPTESLGVTVGEEAPVDELRLLFDDICSNAVLK